MSRLWWQVKIQRASLAVSRISDLRAPISASSHISAWSTPPWVEPVIRPYLEALREIIDRPANAASIFIRAFPAPPPGKTP